MSNMYDDLLKQINIERAKRHAKRRQEWATYHANKPQTQTPSDEKPQPMEYRDYLRKRIRELLT